MPANAITDIALWTVALLATFEGARRIASRRRTRAAILMVTAGILWLALTGGYALFVGLSLDDLREPLDSAAVVAPLPQDWGAQMPGPDREKAGAAYAAAVFRKSGQLIEYFDQTGQRKLFNPTQEQVRKREASVRLAQRMLDTSEQSLSYGLWSIGAAVVAVVLGATIGAKYDG